MCDCYYTRCQGCKRQLSMHIADCCVPRSKVRVWCPQCADRYRGTRVVLRGKIVLFGDVVARNDQVLAPDGKPVGRGMMGRPVLIVCLDAKGYGIHLN